MPRVVFERDNSRGVSRPMFILDLPEQFNISKKDLLKNRVTRFSNCDYSIDNRTLSVFNGSKNITLCYFDGIGTDSYGHEIQSFSITNGGGCGFTLFEDMQVDSEKVSTNWMPDKSMSWDADITNDILSYYDDVVGVVSCTLPTVLNLDFYDLKYWVKQALGIHSAYRGLYDFVADYYKINH